MNKYKALALIIALILPAAFTSCNGLLDKQPDDRVTVNSPELVRRLLINAYPTATPTLVSELSSDNIDDYGTDNPNYTAAVPSSATRTASSWASPTGMIRPSTIRQTDYVPSGRRTTRRSPMLTRLWRSSISWAIPLP